MMKIGYEVSLVIFEVKRLETTKTSGNKSFDIVCCKGLIVEILSVV